MSLVNQMLKDLEQRRAELPSGDRLRGLRSAPNTTEGTQRSPWPLILVVTAIAGSGFGWWIAGNSTTSSAPPMAQAVPAATTKEQLPAPVLAEADVTPSPALASEIPIAAKPASKPALETATVAALEVHTAPAPAPTPVDIKPVPKPNPVTTTAVAKAQATSSSSSTMHKTLRTTSPQEQAAQHYNSAQQALASGDLYAAETALRTALAADPTYSKAAETLATILIQQGQQAAASQILSAALQHTPTRPRLAMLQARLLAEAGRDAEAVDVLQSAQADGDAEYQALLGGLQQRLGNDTQAAEAYRLALTSAPQRGIWWLGLGISLERSQQAAAALTAYRNALRDTALETQVSDYIRARISALGNGQG